MTSVAYAGAAHPTPLASAVPREYVAACPWVGLAAWGVVVFGAVYDWAFWPLLAASALVGGLFLTARRSGTGVLLAGGPVLGAIVLHLAPLPRHLLESLSPAAVASLGVYDIAFGARPEAAHTLSVSSAMTLRAALSYAAFCTVAAAVSSQLRGAPILRRFARALGGLALVVALLAIIQKATFNGKIYWFWHSDYAWSSNYYGPFVNRNHFAGWMLLASSLTAGFLLSQMAVAGRLTKPGWRNRLLWMGSEEAGRIVITAAALFVMLVSTMWSMSRSGIAATIVALAILAFAASRKAKPGIRRPVAVASILLVLLLAIAWRGADALGDWYGKTGTFEWRVQLWKDTVPALRDFWLTGSGLNTYDKVMTFYPETDTRAHGAYAHNDYLQLAVEGGLLVGIPVLITIGLFVRTVARRLRQPQDDVSWWIRMGAVAGICGMAVQEFTEFSLQIPGVAVLFAMLVGIAIHQPALAERPMRRERRSGA